MKLNTRISKHERTIRLVRIYQQLIQTYIKNHAFGNLFLYYSPLTTLPKNLTHVGGNLDLTGSPIKSLSNDLQYVSGDLNVSYTSIHTLPPTINIMGNLFINHTNISHIPNTLNVKGTIYFKKTPLMKKITIDHMQIIYPKYNHYYHCQLLKYSPYIGILGDDFQKFNLQP